MDKIKVTLVDYAALTLLIILVIRHFWIAGSEAQTKKFIQQQALDIESFLMSAKQLAIHEDSRVVICPTVDNQSCHDNFTSHLLTFIDTNKNFKFDTQDLSKKLISNEKIIEYFLLEDEETQFTFDLGKKNSAIIAFDKDGYLIKPQQVMISICSRNRVDYHTKVLLTKAGLIQKIQSSEHC
ncbi:MAG: hypothetical protein AAGB12_12995 [Pseudomonadota bacterium]